MAGVRVSHAMTTGVIVSTESTPLSDAASMMRKHRISGLPVLDKAGRVVGVLSHKDLVRAVRLVSVAGSPVPPWGWPLDGEWTPNSEQEEFLRRGRVGRAMTPDPVVISPEADLDVAAGIMEERGISRLPVVEDRRLIGILTIHDILSAQGGGGGPRNAKASLLPARR